MITNIRSHRVNVLMTNMADMMTPIKSYKDLRVWQDSMDLAEAIYKATDRFPDRERYGLTNQLRRAAVSVASNIAEGHVRTTGDYIRHLGIARGSIAEVETQLLVSKRLGYLSESDAEALLNPCDRVCRMLGRLRTKLSIRRSRIPSP